MPTLNIFSWFVLLFNYGWTIELLLTYCCSYVDMIAYHTHTHKSKSIITVVEGNGLDHIGQRSQKDGERQDPSLWETCQFWIENNILTCLDICKYELHWKSMEYLTCKFKTTLPFPSPAFPSSNLQLLLLHFAPINSCCAFLILGLFQNLA